MKLLVLLIGGNNIANYALIKYLLPKIDTLSLVYSDETFKNSEVIKTKLQSKNLKIIDINLDNKVRNLDFIKTTIFNKLKDYEIDFLHLNYTGGTKSMGVGSFLAVNELKVKDVEFTDIGYKLFYSDGREVPEKGSFKEMVKLSVEDIIEIYSHKIISKKDKVSDFYSEEFAYFLMDKIRNDENNFYNHLWEIDGLENNKVDELLKKDWKNSLPDNLGFDLDIDKKKLKKLKSFVTGGFLEEYIFDILNSNKDNLNINSVFYNVYIKNSKNAEFEVDLVFSRGYDLYVVSCTTDVTKSKNKGKLIEAAKRASEIGGKEARFILVNLMSTKSNDIEKNNFEKLKRELTEEIKNKYNVLGFEDINNKDKLISKLKELIGTI